MSGLTVSKAGASSRAGRNKERKGSHALPAAWVAPDGITSATLTAHWSNAKVVEVSTLIVHSTPVEGPG